MGKILYGWPAAPVQITAVPLRAAKKYLISHQIQHWLTW
jgi:hypothetical protein